MRFSAKTRLVQQRLLRSQHVDAKRGGFVANKAPSIVRRAMTLDIATVISRDGNGYTTVITSAYPSNRRESRWIFFRARTEAAAVLHRVSNEPRAVLFTAVALTFINFERTRCHIST